MFSYILKSLQLLWKETIHLLSEQQSEKRNELLSCFLLQLLTG